MFKIATVFIGCFCFLISLNCIPRGGSAVSARSWYGKMLYCRNGTRPETPLPLESLSRQVCCKICHQVRICTIPSGKGALSTESTLQRLVEHKNYSARSLCEQWLSTNGNEVDTFTVSATDRFDCTIYRAGTNEVAW